MKFKKKHPYYDLRDIIKYLDRNPKLKSLVKKFTKEGYKMMYL